MPKFNCLMDNNRIITFLTDDEPNPLPCDIRLLQWINSIFPNDYCKHFIEKFRTNYIEKIDLKNCTITRYYPYLSTEELLKII